MYIVKLSSRGQIVIPAEARNTLNLKEGDTLLVHLEDGKIVLKTKQAKVRSDLRTIIRPTPVSSLWSGAGS